MLGVVKSVEVITADITSGLTSVTTSLTKGQNTDNCVPFVTQQNVNATYQPNEWMVDIYFTSTQVVVERTTTGNRIICAVVVVEFDPNRVRVQQKSFSMPLVGGTSTQTVNVGLDYTVDTSRAAMVHHYRQTSGTQSQATDWAVRRNFSGTTQAQFTRRYSDETAQAGHFYVFESLDGAFTTQRIFIEFNSGVGYNTDTISEVDISKSWIVPHSFYSTRTHAEADSNFMFVKFASSTVVEGFRRGTTSYIQVDTFVVEHHDNTVVTHGQFDYASGQQDKQTALPGAVDEDYSAPLATARDGMLYPQVYAGTAYDRYFARIWYSPNTSTIRGYRQSTSDSMQQRWQSIEFAPAPGYYFGGYVTENGSPVVRTVRAYHRETGELLGETTSSGIGGYYYLETTYSGEQYIVCLDDASYPVFNLLAYDLMVPTTISGG